MTRQYTGGILAGVGVGALAMKFLVRSQGASAVESPLLFICAFLCVAIGSNMALAEQRRIENERKKVEKSATRG